MKGFFLCLIAAICSVAFADCVYKTAQNGQLGYYALNTTGTVPAPANLPDVCPSYHVGEPVCCNSVQVNQMQDQFSALEIFNACPPCIKNFKNLWCTFSCSAQQSDFMSVARMDTKLAGRILAVNTNFSLEFVQGILDSCTSIPLQDGSTFSDLFGADPESFMSFQDMQQPTFPSSGILWSLVSANTSSTPSVQADIEPCAGVCPCSVCTQSCTAKTSIDLEPKIFGMNSGRFAAIVTASVIGALSIAFAGVALYRYRKTSAAARSGVYAQIGAAVAYGSAE